MLDVSRDALTMSGHCLRFEQRIATVMDRLSGVPKHHLSFRNRRTRHEKETYGRVHPRPMRCCVTNST